MPGVRSSARPGATAPTGPGLAITPIEQLKKPKGFEVELVYAVPHEEQGSWVSLAIDPRGRLIASDQHGKLYRVTPSQVGGPAEETPVEPIALEIGECRASSGVRQPVRRGQPDRQVSQRPVPRPRHRRRRPARFDRDAPRARRRHFWRPGRRQRARPARRGARARRPGDLRRCRQQDQADGVAGSRVPRAWGEDSLLPRMVDPAASCATRSAPGGCIYRVTPDGRRWEFVSMGYRNPYDIAFNRDGERRSGPRRCR